MKSWRILSVLLLGMVVAGLVACSPGGNKESSQRLEEVVRGDLTVTVSGSGNIEVANERRLAFGSAGRIDTIYVDEGDRVSKGDRLARLDTSPLELALTQAKLGVVQAQVARDEAEYNLNQLRDILHASHDRVKIAELALAAAEEQIGAAEQAVAEAQKRIDEAIITAPFGGVIANVNVDEGDNVTPAVPIIYLIDLTGMELNAEVDEIDIADVEPGQRAVIEVDALPALQLEGEVVSISQLPSTQGGVVVYKVKIGFDAPADSELRVGMTATADIIINERSDVLLVPNRAVKKDSQGKPIVEVMAGEQVEERSVAIGISDGLETEILEGLKEGEVVVIKRQ